MNREIHYEGWLIKSPPTKRIWRARWRRRWFTLKQGEIPEQFCLEYYTDRNCRKLKGVIDLDQCEQVDCGLRLENRKQKFQFMFDIKTPKRTYYLAADTEADMRDWVNCICQVCHLHDTKQSNELQQDENRTQSTGTSALTNSTNNTTTTSLNSSSSATAGAAGAATVADSTGGATIQRQSFCNDILRRSTSTTVVDQQPRTKNTLATVTYQNNSDCAYVNTEYTNRETVLCDARFDRQQLAAAIVGAAAAAAQPQNQSSPPTQCSSAVYLNTSMFQTQSPTPTDGNGRLVVSASGVVRKIPESLVLNNTPLPETQTHSVQPSPALSTSSGPYIPISECFSGSPKFILDANNPTTPLNNLDPKFYDTPRCHNNIGLNLTNDQSYSPKITNCSLQQIATAKNRSHRSDSDSESVFTDDDEWTHPLPLRENVDRSTRPSDSSVENESFVLTYSQRFSKMPDDNGKMPSPAATAATADIAAGGDPNKGVAANGTDPLEKLAKVLKNKNNLILDFKENDKLHRDMPQLSDTENTSPAIGPRDSTSVVEESYDIPRSQNLPYYNMAHLFDKSNSPHANPIAASTPNLMAGSTGAVGALATGAAASGACGTDSVAPASPATVRTLPRQHCYTNAAPSRVEGTVFRYDFVEQSNLPPVNRKLKPKVQSVEDRPPEEVAAKPPVANAACQQNSPKILENLTNKLMTTNLQSPTGSCASGASGGGGGENSPLKPPSVDRKLKPYAYKFGASGGSMTMAPSSRRAGGAPLSMVLTNERDTYVLATRTLPRHPPLPIYSNEGGNGNGGAAAGAAPVTVQHQRTASAAAAMQFTQIFQQQQQLQQHQQQQQQHQQHSKSNNNEHKLQYFDLDVANPPPINRQSMSVGNLYAAGSHRLGQSMDPFARGLVTSGVVYNYVDFVKTEAFKRIREERKKESEGVSGTATGSTNSGSSSTSATNK